MSWALRSSVGTCVFVTQWESGPQKQLADRNIQRAILNVFTQIFLWLPSVFDINIDLLGDIVINVANGLVGSNAQRESLRK